MSSKTRATATKDEATSALVPKLRFPEFRGAAEWDIEEVSDLLDESRTPSLQNDPSRRITVRLHLQGVEHREHRGTESTESTNNFRRKAGQFIYGKQNIHKGAFGIIPSHLDGFETSQDLPCFDFKGRCCPLWLYYHFASESVYGPLELKMTGTGSKRLNEKTFLSLPIAVPPYPEQQKIAECLSSVDELMAAQARKVDALKTHKKGLMQQLFPREGETQPRLRFPEFQNAGEWARMSIQEMIDRQFIVGHLDGNHGELYPKAEEFSQNKEGIPYITANDFMNGSVEFSRCKRLPIERARLFKKGVAKDGDILFAHNATVGPVAKLNTSEEFVILSTTATYFRCNSTHLSNDFLKSALSSPDFVAQYSRVMSQSTRNQVPITTQRKLELYVPKPPEQQRIASCLSSLDALITAEAQKLEALRTHKKGLMQQLFPFRDEVEA